MGAECACSSWVHLQPTVNTFLRWASNAHEPVMLQTKADGAVTPAAADQPVAAARPSAREDDRTSSTDVALVGLARAGDRDAMTELYRRHCRMIHGILLTRVAAADADDLVQEVFVHALDR